MEFSASMNEEQVSEVFVRTISKGKSLNQADFVLILMSVFWDEARTEIKEFCRRSCSGCRCGRRGPKWGFSFGLLERIMDHLNLTIVKREERADEEAERKKAEPEAAGSRPEGDRD